MLRSRIIPCLLIHQGGLYKTQGFKNPKYVGDPINAVRIFNEKKADELIVLDIDASVQKRGPNLNLIEKLAEECTMPLCYGGGIKTVEEAVQIVDMGVEKIAISSAAIIDPLILSDLAEVIGRQSVVAVIDVRKKMSLFSKGYEVVTYNAKEVHKNDPILLAKQLQDAGAGEILINSVDHDGMMKGYDLELAVQFKDVLRVPTTYMGGAGSHEDIKLLISRIGTIGAAAGSLFVFKGKYRAVLLNYPSNAEKEEICYYQHQHKL